MMVGSVHSNGWTPGEKVIARRVVDAVTARGPAVERVKVGEDGIVAIDGLEPGVYHLTGDFGDPVRQCRVTVQAEPENVEPAPAPPAKLTPEEIARRLARTRPPESRSEPIEGMRSTAHVRQRRVLDVGRRPRVDVGRQAA